MFFFIASRRKIPLAVIGGRFLIRRLRLGPVTLFFIFDTRVSLIRRQQHAGAPAARDLLGRPQRFSGVLGAHPYQDCQRQALPGQRVGLRGCSRSAINLPPQRNRLPPSCLKPKAKTSPNHQIPRARTKLLVRSESCLVLIPAIAIQKTKKPLIFKGLL